MSNVIDLMPYIENKKAMDSFKEAELKQKDLTNKITSGLTVANLKTNFLSDKEYNKLFNMEEE